MVAGSQSKSVSELLREKLVAAVEQRDAIKDEKQRVLGSPEGPSLASSQREWIRLDALRRELEAIGEEIKKAQDAIEPSIMEEMAEMGQEKVTIDGYTLHTRTDRYVSKKGEFTQNDVCSAVRKLGWGYLVSEGYNSAKLKSAVLELLDNGEELPESIKGMLNVGEITRLASRKA